LAPSAEETLWVLRAQSGDRDAVEQLLLRVRPALARFVRGVVGLADAEDVVQDVLVLIYRNLVWLRDPDLFRPWAFRIASRAAFRHLKKARRAPLHVAEDVLETVQVDEKRPSDEALAALLSVDTVSPASRAVLILHFQEELTLAAVAAVLEIPIGTVRSRLAYGLTVLRKRLSDTEKGR
jgi:RNA polymerase sigma-70 factor, ECF subfamily